MTLTANVFSEGHDSSQFVVIVSADAEWRAGLKPPFSPKAAEPQVQVTSTFEL